MRFDSFMENENFVKSIFDSCVYLRNVNILKEIYLLLDMDDMLISSGDLAEIQKVKDNLS